VLETRLAASEDRISELEQFVADAKQAESGSDQQLIEVSSVHLRRGADEMVAERASRVVFVLVERNSTTPIST